MLMKITSPFLSFPFWTPLPLFSTPYGWNTLLHFFNNSIFFLFSSFSLQLMGCMSSHLLMNQIFKSSFHLSPSNHTSNHWIQIQIQSFELNPFNGPSNCSLIWYKNILCLSKTSQNYKSKFVLHKLQRIKCWKWNESENFEKTQQIFVWSNFKITIEHL